jgi:hypothetical protein
LYGNKSTLEKFQKTTNPNIPESYVRKMKKLYEASRKQANGVEAVVRVMMKKQNRGRPLSLGHWDLQVQMYLRKLRTCGGKVNRHIVLAAARGILSRNQPSLLQVNNGKHLLTNSWAKSLLRRMKFVKRKGTKAAKKVPANFEDIRAAFLNRVHDKVQQYQIPPELIANFDETGAPYIPVSDWTMEEQGANQVPMFGYDDKRQMTVFLGIAASGDLLPCQLIYEGKTNLCHPQGIQFPPSWDVTHT